MRENSINYLLENEQQYQNWYGLFILKNKVPRKQIPYYIYWSLLASNWALVGADYILFGLFFGICELILAFFVIITKGQVYGLYLLIDICTDSYLSCMFMSTGTYFMYIYNELFVNDPRNAVNEVTNSILSIILVIL